MDFDHWLLHNINGLAGHWLVLDNLGRIIAVDGPLAVALLVVAVAWWPSFAWQVRRRYLLSLVITAAVVAALFGGQVFVENYWLHHAMRDRPTNTQWVTALVTEPTRWGFPAWPVLACAALSVVTYRTLRAAGAAIAGLTVLVAVGLVFVGANSPFDVLTGILVGLVVGSVAATVGSRVSGLGSRMSGSDGASPSRVAVTRYVILVLALAIWGVILFIAARPATGNSKPAPTSLVVRLKPPDVAKEALRALVDSDRHVLLEGGTNGHMDVGNVELRVPGAFPTREAAEDLARRAVNLTMINWPQLDLLTVTILHVVPQGKHEAWSTLLTTTVDRAVWPTGGFVPGSTLPGKVYESPELGKTTQ